MPGLEPLHGDGDEPREIRELRRRLNSLPAGHALAFGASCCERILPCYDACARREQHGDFPTLRRHLDAIWDLSLRDASATGPPVLDREDARILHEGLSRAFPFAYPRVPRPEGCYDWEFEWVLAEQAEYAACAVAAMVQGYLEGRGADYAAVAADAALQAVRDFVGVMNDPSPPHGWDATLGVIDADDELMPPWGYQHDREAEMYRDFVEELPLMVQEREKQGLDLAALAARPRLDRAFLDEFRKAAAEGGIQPFRRGLWASRPSNRTDPE